MKVRVLVQRAIIFRARFKILRPIFIRPLLASPFVGRGRASGAGEGHHQAILR
jgi:hypothetical protein